MKDRRLTFFEPGRSLFDEYVCKIIDLKKERNVTVDELLGRGHEMSLDHTIWILERFNWPQPPKQILVEDQQKFLEGDSHNFVRLR